ncbi:ribosome-associated ATPase/putative transporter RbbA [Hydrogenophilus islandicus]
MASIFAADAAAESSKSASPTCPKGLGKNLYPTLSVWENVTHFADLFALPEPQRSQTINRLLTATDLLRFRDRPAGKLSGGMKQKLSLCCALINDPDWLILDEPTTGVDPLSRRRFWNLIAQFQAERPQLKVIVATAYMEEAEHFDTLLALYEGRIIGKGTPEELKRQTETATLEAAFARLMLRDRTALSGVAHGSATPPSLSSGSETPMDPPPGVDDARPIVIAAEGLTQRFGDFVAVDHVSFAIRQGEIFGFLGSNGCGKTTTMKMLTGLLPPTEGRSRLFGTPLAPNDSATRRLVGYMTQQFSLYQELSIADNLWLHARIFEIPEEQARQRIEKLLERFDLARFRDQIAESLPLGVKQRLSLAVAVLHEPKVLILDEPTSGVDPVARDQFWALLYELSRQEGVTIFLSTHFMNEAMRCDRISLMHAGRVLIQDTPERIIAHYGADSLETAFIRALEAEEAKANPPLDLPPTTAAATTPPSSTGDGDSPLSLSSSEAPPAGSSPIRTPSFAPLFSFTRLLSVAKREGRELMRDPVRLVFALLGAVILMFVLASGISLDVDRLPVAVYDGDQSTESRDYIAQVDATREFEVVLRVSNLEELLTALRDGKAAVGYGFPSGFAADLRRGRRPELGVWIDGSMPFRGETARGYVLAIHRAILGQWQSLEVGPGGELPVALSVRYRYNPELRSVNAMAPAVIPLLLIFIPAILTALAVVREKELGSIVNLYVTPLSRSEFLLGKQLPYVAVSFVAFLLLLAQTRWGYDVPLKGDLLFLAGATLLYLLATTSFGLLLSTVTRTQVAALFGTAILTMLPSIEFSGLTTPVSASEGIPRWIGEGFPVSHYLTISRGIITKAVSGEILRDELLWLALFPLCYGLLAVWRLPKQEP